MTAKERCNYLIKWFQANEPDPKSELHYSSPYQLLVAVILSAQCTDKRVNIVTKQLFKAFPTVKKLAEASQEEVFTLIRSISYPNNKAKHLVEMARLLVDNFQGELPSDPELLQSLPGVGRKTANVVASIIFNRPVMAVDTHVFRVAERIGLTSNSKSPLETEKVLTGLFPTDLIPKAHHWLILHGRYVCIARKPKCHECGIRSWCRYFAENKSTN